MDINYYEVRSADLPSMLTTSGVHVFSSVPFFIVLTLQIYILFLKAQPFSKKNIKFRYQQAQTMPIHHKL